jgi:phosphoglycerate kinase
MEVKKMSLNKKSVDDINVKGQRVLCRCDFNVPLKNGEITDENRLVAALPTIKKLIADGGKVILCSHLGKVKTEEDKQTKTLAPVAARLTELLGQEVKFVAEPEVVGDKVRAAVDEMKDGEVILLENTRFRAEETKNGEAFSKDLASICDVFVNDAFGTAHRAHCSNVGVAGLVDTAVVGYLMQKEIDFLGNAVENPVRPFVAILGGAKVADKLNVISNLLEKCDTLIIGGGMAYTFLKAKGYEIGKSLVDESKIDYCKEMMEKADKLGKKLLLPVDSVMIDDFPNPIDDPSIATVVCDADKMSADKEGCDIGPKTVELYSEAVKSAKTVVWNGPMGVFENPVLATGTKAVAAALAETDATTIIGGGDSAAAVNQLGYGDKMSHISTGGGASLEFLEGKELPGVAAANDK